MVKKKLIVFDFDKTLIPFDSFRSYLFFLLKRYPVQVGWHLLKRLLHMYSSFELKKIICKMVSDNIEMQQNSEIFADKLIDRIIWPEPFIEKNSIPLDSVIVVLTASPCSYMKYVENMLKFKWNFLNLRVICTGFYDDEFVEMYGINKYDYIISNYCKSKYEYYYAISDSSSDLCWMKLFVKYKVVKIN